MACQIPDEDNDKSYLELKQTLRELTIEEREKLEKDVKLVTAFKQEKLEKEAQKNWDLFYKRNTTKFFKDRHWTTREFSDLVQRKVFYLTVHLNEIPIFSVELSKHILVILTKMGCFMAVLVNVKSLTFRFL